MKYWIGVLLFFFVSSALADTTIKYQGKLETVDGAFEGQAVMAFELYSALEGGTLIAGPVILPDVTVSDGVFEVELDFGSVYDDGPVFLAIYVENEALLPRQQVRAVPLAVRALSAPEPPPAWLLSGNSGTVSGQAFLGTTDATTLDVRVNNRSAIRVVPSPFPAGPPSIIGGHEENFVLNDHSGSTIAGGGVAGLPNVVGEASVVSGGYDNRAAGRLSVVSGGISNRTEGIDTVISGGARNQALGHKSVVGGGAENIAGGGDSVIGGGSNNRTAERGSVVAGGLENEALEVSTTVSGGSGNKATLAEATVGGGTNNIASGQISTISGGGGNVASQTWATVSGGSNNFANGQLSTIGGGADNEVSGSHTVVGGGSLNRVIESEGAIVGGRSNTAGAAAFVGGGQVNEASGIQAAIVGGQDNLASGFRAVVGGGVGNVASGENSAVAGGWGNQAIGFGSAVPGGAFNIAGGTFGIAAGHNSVIDATHNGVFLFADDSGQPFNSEAANEFAVRATGGVRFVVGNSTCRLNTSTGTFDCAAEAAPAQNQMLKAAVPRNRSGDVDEFMNSDDRIATLEAQNNELRARISALEEFILRIPESALENDR